MSAEILADSYNTRTGDRLTTFRISFPRCVLAEFNTYRMFSRNSASSRAIPIKRQIERVELDPYVPEVFGSYAKGMGQGTADSATEAQLRNQWMRAMEAACSSARMMDEFGGAKQQANRVLEPYIKDHTVIVTATDLDNFFAQRLPTVPVGQQADGMDVYEVIYDTEQFGPQASPEMQRVAIEMYEALYQSEPRSLEPGDWHLPLASADEAPNMRAAAAMSAGRCAKVSYDRELEKEIGSASAGRTQALADSNHWSPLEHPAQAMSESRYEGNFRGWKQLRKFYFGESGQRTKTF